MQGEWSYYYFAHCPAQCSVRNSNKTSAHRLFQSRGSVRRRRGKRRSPRTREATLSGSPPDPTSALYVPLHAPRTSVSSIQAPARPTFGISDVGQVGQENTESLQHPVRFAPAPVPKERRRKEGRHAKRRTEEERLQERRREHQWRQEP